MTAFLDGMEPIGRAVADWGDHRPRRQSHLGRVDEHGDYHSPNVCHEITTLALLATAAVSVAAAGVGAYSSIQAGNAQAAAAGYNAQLQRAEAQQAQDQAAAEAQQQQTKTKLDIGNALAAAGASGVDPNQGSPANVLGMIAQQGELSRQLILYNGQYNATNFLNQANVSIFQGQQAQQAGINTAGTTLLSAAGRTSQLFTTPSGPSLSLSTAPGTISRLPGLLTTTAT